MQSFQDLAASYTKAHDSHDAEAMSQLCSPTCVLVGPVDSIRGREAIKKLLERFLAAFGEDRFIVNRLLVADSTLVLEWTFEARHIATYHGPTGDIAATGRALKLDGVDVFDVGDGNQIVRYRSYFDHFDLLTQLGAGAVD